MIVLRLLVENYSSKQIATLFYMSKHTVENHRSKIVKKLKLPTGQSSLLHWAIKHKMMLGKL